MGDADIVFASANPPRLFILEIFSMDYRQKNPLKYYVLPFLLEFVSNVH